MPRQGGYQSTPQFYCVDAAGLSVAAVGGHGAGASASQHVGHIDRRTELAEAGNATKCGLQAAPAGEGVVASPGGPHWKFPLEIEPRRFAMLRARQYVNQCALPCEALFPPAECACRLTPLARAVSGLFPPVCGALSVILCLLRAITAL